MIDTYSMERLFEIQKEDFRNPSDKVQLMRYISSQLFPLIKSLTSGDFLNLKAYETADLVLKCCNGINENSNNID